jgi:hypothetical protein
MFQTINEGRKVWPIGSGFGIVALVILIAIIAQMLVVSEMYVRVPAASAVTLILPPKPAKSRMVTKKATQENHATIPGTEADAGAKARTAIARPGTREWQAQTARGRELHFDVIAEGSLPVLRANGTLLAIDVVRPLRGTYLFDLHDQSLHRGAIPAGAIVRELTNMPPFPGFDEARRTVAHELGGPPQTFALYASDLYYALRGLTEEILRKESVPVSSVVMVRVQLRLFEGKTFSVTLLSYS